MSEFLHELEEYPDLEGSIIRVTKIHKVLKQILKLNSIPLEEEFHFKDRSRDLLAKWNDTLSNDPTGSGDKEDGKEGEEPKTAALPATNGETSKAATAEKEKPAETEKPAVSDVKPAEKGEENIETTSEPTEKVEEGIAEEKAQEPAESLEAKKIEEPAAVHVLAVEPNPLIASVTESVTEPIV